MCGFVGIIFNDCTKKVDRQDLIKMGKTLKHRGPDYRGIWIENNIGFIHQRLAIIDLSDNANQPMANFDGTIHLVFNGMIYNYKNLRGILQEKGYKFKSSSDTEVIIKSYEEWGIDCLEKFDGMFSFLLWDHKRQHIFGARDRFGEKPLFWSKIESDYIFASEIKAIAAWPKYKHSVNEKILTAYISYGYTPSYNEETFYDKIYRILPAHAFTLTSKGDFKKWKYWRLSLLDPIEESENKTVLRFKQLFTDALKYRSISDVPIGSCLSGGLDSSSIVCLMKTLKIRDTYHTFSIRNNDSLLDEGKFIRAVVEHVNTIHHEVWPALDDFHEDLEKFLFHLEEPYGSISSYASYCLYRLAKEKGIKVLLDGQGGDELLCGYTSDFWDALLEMSNRKGLHYARKQQQILYNLHTSSQDGGDITSPENFSFLTMLYKRYLEFKKYNKYYRFGIDKLDVLRIIFKKRICSRNDNLPLSKAESIYHSGDDIDSKFAKRYPLIAKTVKRLTNGLFSSLLDYTDRASMANSVEVRLPFLYEPLVIFSLSLSVENKVHIGYSKYILRRSMANILPPLILQRLDKKGFTVPQGDWLMKLDQDWLKSRVKKVEPYLLRMPNDSKELWRILSSSFVIEGLVQRSF
jgi:asparagine synthase (glutamine-hydrolysing)